MCLQHMKLCKVNTIWNTVVLHSLLTFLKVYPHHTVDFLSLHCESPGFLVKPHQIYLCKLVIYELFTMEYIIKMHPVKATFLQHISCCINSQLFLEFSKC